MPLSDEQKRMTVDEIHAVISSGPAVPCPACGAEWSAPLYGDGTPVRNPANQVMIHDVECPAYVEPQWDPNPDAQDA